jgi:hypothetical protein
LTTAPGHQAVAQRGGHQNGRDKVGVEVSSPGGRQLGQARGHRRPDVGVAPGAVDQHVDVRGELVERCLHRGGIGRVKSDVAYRGTQFGSRLLEHIGSLPGDHHGVSGVGERPGDRLADSRPAAGDDDVPHCVPPRLGIPVGAVPMIYEAGTQ